MAIHALFFLILRFRGDLGPARRLFPQGKKFPIEGVLLLDRNATHSTEQLAAFGNVGFHQLQISQHARSFGFAQRCTFRQGRK